MASEVAKIAFVFIEACVIILALKGVDFLAAKARLANAQAAAVLLDTEQKRARGG